MTSDYVEYEQIDSETGDVVGRGETLRSTIEAMISAGHPLRIVRSLGPIAPDPSSQNED
jgi:hypothetical protein